ncbi:hypothetical protein C8R46DRAFT_212530 [Mycena filopes]|nr:hypothetical protein C8R46DRAFT_212530 [Mycena filopes]
MHQVGWMRHRLCPAVAIPAVSCKSTRPGSLRVHLLNVPLVRDSSSVHLRLSPRVWTPRRQQNIQIAPNQSLGSTPSGIHRASSPHTSLMNLVHNGLPLPRATSQTSLYQNLLSLQPASLPILLDYHIIHDDLRSVVSYNLLISLAIRHTAYGSVQFLLHAMSADQIGGNLQTEKLKTRWLLRIGQWERAWHEVATAHPHPIPLPLWLEFLQGVTGVLPSHRSAVRRRPTRVTSPQTRFQMLMQNIPPFTPKQAYHSVGTIRVLARAMLALKRPRAALTLTTRYFNSLPRRIDDKWAKHCVTIINSVVAFESRKRGLVDFHSARRKLNSLLALHPFFRPTSRTLFVLLATLRQVKRRGTVAWQTLIQFKTRWGPLVEDRPVRRRVAMYAIQERRLEIVNKIFDAERRSRRLEREARSSGEQPLVLSRQMPFREIFLRRNYEERLWKLLSMRARKVKLQLKEKDGDKV